MATEPLTMEPAYEPEDEMEDAHEHGVVFHQIEETIPLLAEDADEEDEGDGDA